MTSTPDGKMKSVILTVQRRGETVCPASRFQQMVSGKYKLRILWGLTEGLLVRIWPGEPFLSWGSLEDQMAQELEGVADIHFETELRIGRG